MAETKVGGVHVSASIGTAEYSADAKKLKAETVALERSLKSSFGGMAAAVKGFGGALTAGLSIGLLAGMAKKALDFAAAIGTTAKQLGVSTKELQTFRHAAGQVGVKVAESDKAIEKLGSSMSKAAAGSKPTIAAFEAVGVKIADIRSKNPIQLFAQISDHMNKQGGAAKNLAQGNILMGESFNKLIPLADKGSKGINELSLAAERLGVVLSDEQIQRADETARKLEDVKTVLSAQIAGVVADNAASIVSLANALASLTSSIVNFLGSNPQAALGILGALAGSRFGLPGAAAGGFAGMVAGAKVGRDAANANMDPRFRAQEIRKAQTALNKARSGAGDPTGKLGANPAAIAAAERELARQNALGQQALSRGGASRGAGSAAIPQFLAPAAKAGRKGRTPRAPKDTSLRDAHQFDMEIRRAQMDVLRATQSLSNDFIERSAIAIQLLDLEKSTFDAELKYRVASGDINAAQAEQLKLEYEKKDALERQIVLADEAAQTAEAAARLDQVTFELDRNKLESEAQLADTAKEQRDVQLRLLDLAYRQEKIRLETIRDDETLAYAAREEARRRLQGLEETRANDTAAVIQGTRGPWEEFADAATDAKKLEEAFQSVAVNGVGALADGLTDVIMGTRSLGDVFKQVAAQILADLLRIQIQKMLVQAIGGIGLGFESGGFVPGFASGGFTGWGNTKRIAGFVHGREGVLNAPAMRRLGVPNLNALNAGVPLAAVVNDNGTGQRTIVQNFNFPNSDYDSFKRSERQMSSMARRRLALA